MDSESSKTQSAPPNRSDKVAPGARLPILPSLAYPLQATTARGAEARAWLQQVAVVSTGSPFEREPGSPLPTDAKTRRGADPACFSTTNFAYLYKKWFSATIPPDRVSRNTGLYDKSCRAKYHGTGPPEHPDTTDRCPGGRSTDRSPSLRSSRRHVGELVAFQGCCRKSSAASYPWATLHPLAAG